jgi:hypothetical protein
VRPRAHRFARTDARGGYHDRWGDGGEVDARGRAHAARVLPPGGESFLARQRGRDGRVPGVRRRRDVAVAATRRPGRRDGHDRHGVLDDDHRDRDRRDARRHDRPARRHDRPARRHDRPARPHPGERATRRPARTHAELEGGARGDRERDRVTAADRPRGVPRRHPRGDDPTQRVATRARARRRERGPPGGRHRPRRGRRGERHRRQGRPPVGLVRVLRRALGRTRIRLLHDARTRRTQPGRVRPRTRRRRRRRTRSPRARARCTAPRAST